MLEGHQRRRRPESRGDSAILDIKVLKTIISLFQLLMLRQATHPRGIKPPEFERERDSRADG